MHTRTHVVIDPTLHQINSRTHTRTKGASTLI